MTKTLRRAGLLTLSMLVMVFSIAGVATAQDEPASCYPVPPGGCAPEEITCEDIIAAIEADDPALDQNGDGVMDAADLPPECTCEELIDAVDAGILSEDDLPEECIEVEVAEEPSEEPTEEVEAAGLADTGLDAGPMAAFALAGLLAGMLLVRSTRRA